MNSFRQVSAIASRVGRTAVPLSLVTALIVGLICWFGGFRSWSQFGSGLQYAAMLLLILGGFGLLAGSSGLGWGRAMIPRPDFARALYQHRTDQLTRGSYEFRVGGAAAVMLYFFSRAVFDLLA